MYEQQLIPAVAVCLILTLAGQLARAVDPPTTRPTTGPSAPSASGLRRVEVPLLGRVADLKGVRWPDELQRRWRSWSVDESCDLIVRLPSGKALTVQTRPILVISREGDTIVTVIVPPVEAKAAWLADQAKVMEKLLVDWHAIPSERMRALIDEFKRIPPPKPGDLVPSAGIERVGNARLDDQSELLFELIVGPGGKWDLVAVISGRGKGETRKR